jgi:hypothetical protein
LERNISDAQNQKTLENADYTISTEGRRVAVIQFAGNNLSVVYVEKKTSIKIITVTNKVVEMNVNYDKDSDAAYIYLKTISPGKVKRTIEMDKNIILDFNWP